MKLKLGALLFLLTVFAFLTGCGGGGSSSNPTPNVSLVSISVAGASSVNVGDTASLAATGHYSDGSSKDVTSSAIWSSSSSALATVNSAGLVSAVKGGSVTITASLGAVKGSLTLNVQALLSSISVTATGSSVYVGSSLQFTATGNYNDGTSKDLSATATWNSSDASRASVNNHGLSTGLLGGSTTITATSGAVSGSQLLSVVALLNSIDLTPVGPGVVVGDSVQFSAIGRYNDGTTSNLTSSATWVSSDSSKASVGATGLASATARGAVTVSVSASSADGTLVSNSTALNVTTPPATPPSLSGSYAFTITSADTRGPQFFAGSFTIDGHGGLTGIEDANTGAGVQQNVALAGTYAIYPDGRGTIVFNANSINPSGITFRFILAGNGTIGKLIQFDGAATAKGSFEPQNVAAFNAASISGTYVFRATGIDAATQPVGQIGMFTADGLGGIGGGTYDQDDYGIVSAMSAILPGTYSVNSNGRGVLQLATASGVANFAAYVVGSEKINLIQIDAAPATALAGVAELQVAQKYLASTLNGGYSFLLERPALIRTSGFDRREFAQIGAYSFDAVSAITGARDDANNGVSNPLDGITGAYSVGLAGVAGRGTLTAVSSLGNRSYVFYMVSPDRMYILQTYNGSTTGSLNAPVGVAQQQVERPYTVGSLNGTYAVDLSDLTATYTEVLMQMVFDGSGGLYGMADLSRAGVVSSVVLNASYSVSSSDSTFGRGVIVLPSPLGANNYAFYLISSHQAWLLGITPNAEGSINLQ